jgi:hypothetical protein
MHAYVELLPTPEKCWEILLGAVPGRYPLHGTRMARRRRVAVELSPAARLVRTSRPVLSHISPLSATSALDAAERATLRGLSRRATRGAGPSGAA